MSYQDPLSTVDQQVIENELETLFFCNGKNLSDKMKAAWIREIDKSSIPAKAILQGIISLKGEDLDSMKLNRIFFSARKFVEIENVRSCENCSDGFVIMKDEEGHLFSLQCRCAAGISKQSHGLVRWSGEKAQFSRGKMLNKIDISTQ